jgi:hypothetical protein
MTLVNIGVISKAGIRWLLFFGYKNLSKQEILPIYSKTWLHPKCSYDGTT